MIHVTSRPGKTLSKIKIQLIHSRNASSSYNLEKSKQTFNYIDEFDSLDSYSSRDYQGDVLINNASLNGYFGKTYNQNVITSFGNVIERGNSDVYITH